MFRIWSQATPHLFAHLRRGILFWSPVLDGNSNFCVVILNCKCFWNVTRPNCTVQQYSAVFIHVTMSPQSIANIYPNMTFRPLWSSLWSRNVGFLAVYIYSFIFEYMSSMSIWECFELISNIILYAIVVIVCSGVRCDVAIIINTLKGTSQTHFIDNRAICEHADKVVLSEDARNIQ